MRSIRARLAGLEQRVKARVERANLPALEEVRAAHRRNLDRARALLRGEGVDEAQRKKDRDTLRRDRGARGISDEEATGHAAQAKAKLLDFARKNAPHDDP